MNIPWASILRAIPGGATGERALQLMRRRNQAAARRDKAAAERLGRVPEVQEVQEVRKKG